MYIIHDKVQLNVASLISLIYVSYVYETLANRATEKTYSTSLSGSNHVNALRGGYVHAHVHHR